MGEYFKQCLEALSYMYNPSVDQIVRAQANEFLSDFLHKSSALSAASQLLATDNLPAPFYFYAANAILFRLRMAFEDLPTIESQQDLRQTLFSHLQRFNVNPTAVSSELSHDRHLSVSERLCSAVAALMIQMMSASTWPSAITDVFQIFTAVPSNADNVQGMQDINAFILVNILASIPDILYDHRLVIPNTSDSDIVENDCRTKETFIYQLCRQYLATSGSNTKLQLKVFDLLSSWSSHYFLSLESIYKHDLYGFILSALEMPQFTIKACHTLSGLVAASRTFMNSTAGFGEKPEWLVKCLDETLRALTIYRYVYTAHDSAIPMAIMNVLVDINEVLLDLLIFDPHPTPEPIRQQFLHQRQNCQQVSTSTPSQHNSTIVSSYVTPFPQSTHDLAFGALAYLASFMLLTTDPCYAYAVLTGQVDIDAPHLYPSLAGGNNSNPPQITISLQHIPEKYHAFDLQLPLTQTYQYESTTQHRGLLTPALRYWDALNDACYRHADELRSQLSHFLDKHREHMDGLSGATISGVDLDYEREITSLRSQMDTFKSKREFYSPIFLTILRALSLSYQCPRDYDINDTDLRDEHHQFRSEFSACIDDILTIVPATTAFQFLCTEIREVIQPFAAMPQYLDYTQKQQQASSSNPPTSREIIYPLSFNGWQPTEAYLSILSDVAPRLVNAVAHICKVPREHEQYLTGHFFQLVDLPSLYFQEQESQRVADAYVPEYIELLQVLMNIGELLPISTSFYKNQVLLTTVYRLIDQYCVFLTFSAPLLAVVTDYHPKTLITLQQQAIPPVITTKCKSNAEIILDLLQFIFPTLHTISLQSPSHLVPPDVQRHLSMTNQPLFIEDAARSILQIAIKCSRLMSTTSELNHFTHGLLENYHASFHVSTHDMLALAIYHVLSSTPSNNVEEFKQHFTRLLVLIKNRLSTHIDQVGVLETKLQQQALNPQQYKEQRDPLDECILQDLHSVNRILSTPQQRHEDDPIEQQTKSILLQFVSSTSDLFQQIIHRYITYIAEDLRVDKICLIWTRTLSRCRHQASALVTPLCNTVCEYFARVKHSGLVYIADNIVRVVAGFEVAQNDYMIRNNTTVLPDDQQRIHAHEIIANLSNFFLPTFIEFCTGYANNQQYYSHLMSVAGQVVSTPGQGNRTIGMSIAVPTNDIQILQHGIVHAALQHDLPLVQNILIEPYVSQTVQISAAGEAYPELTEDLTGFLCAVSTQSPDTLYQSPQLPAILQILTSMLTVNAPSLYRLSVDFFHMFIDAFVVDGTASHIVHESLHPQQLTEIEQWRQVYLEQYPQRLAVYCLIVKILPVLYCYTLFSIVSFRPTRCAQSAVRLLCTLSIFYLQTLHRHRSDNSQHYPVPQQYDNVMALVRSLPELEETITMSLGHSIFAKIHVNLKRDAVHSLRELVYGTSRCIKRAEDALVEIVRVLKGESKESQFDM